MISVIVPVYNVEAYLGKCLESIIAQTYGDLEILVIDDGSTDRSGTICDKNAEKDSRIRVFHTENRGLSAARNLGLDNAHGEWIGFIDSDDWVEPNMYEVLIRKAEETGADIVQCGVYSEYPNRTVEGKRKYRLISEEDAINCLLHKEITTGIWDKMYNAHCFANIRFPEGRINEDVATTHYLISAAKKICTIPENKYHYVQRKDSLSKIHKPKYLIDYWLANFERYEELVNKADEASKRELLRGCSSAAGRTWAYYCDWTKEDKEQLTKYIQEMHLFSREHIPLFGFKEWSTTFRIGVFFPHFMNIVSLRMAWILNRLHKNMK